MFLKSLVWVLISVSVLSLSETKTLSRRRQLRQYLLEDQRDLNSTSKSWQFEGRATGQAKIARVRTADGRSLRMTEGQKNSDPKISDPLLDELSRRKLEFVRDQGVPTVSSVHFRPRRFHCRPIQDTHVPKVNRTLPAYMCKLGARQFVLTSEKFLHDRKSHVDVSIDEATFLRLSKGAPANHTQVIPAMLVFNKEDNVYGIKKT